MCMYNLYKINMQLGINLVIYSTDEQVPFNKTLTKE